MPTRGAHRTETRPKAGETPRAAWLEAAVDRLERAGSQPSESRSLDFAYDTIESRRRTSSASAARPFEVRA